MITWHTAILVTVIFPRVVRGGQLLGAMGPGGEKLTWEACGDHALLLSESLPPSSLM